MGAALMTSSVVAQTCCPQPPDGYDCYVEAPAQLPGSSQIETAYYTGETDMYVGQTHVTQYIAVYHPEVTGYTYEVQYTDSLLGPWKAYARWIGQKDDLVTTFIPIYPCVPQRFIRVCATPPPVLSAVITQHRSNNGKAAK
jgi:hypothetical protein